MQKYRIKFWAEVAALIILLAALSQVVFSRILQQDSDNNPVTIASESRSETLLEASLAPSLYPIRDWSVAYAEIEADCFLAYDVEREAQLAKKRVDKKLPMASITKLATAFTALEAGLQVSEENLILVPEDINNLPLNPVLEAGSKISSKNVFEAMLSASINEAAYVLAASQAEGETFGQRVDNFVKKMNENAAKLGLKNTHFSNPAGFDGGDHYTTCRDLLYLVEEIISYYPQIFSYTLQDEVVVPGVEGDINLSNTNTILDDFNVWGQKTGYTEQAQGGMVLIEENEFGKIIYILLGADNRATAMTNLIEWTHRAYRFPRT